jgi:hypothetical protein
VESRTTPETDPGNAARRGRDATAKSAIMETRWSLRIITRLGDPAASWLKSWESTARRFTDLMPANPICGTFTLFHDKRCRLRNLLF